MDHEAIEALSAEIMSNMQVIRQTDSVIGSYYEGWLSDEAYASAIALRDACREEVARLCGEIEAAGGTPPVDAPSREGYSVAERLAVSDDAVADLSLVISGSVDEERVNADAIAELSEMVAELMGGDE